MGAPYTKAQEGVGGSHSLLQGQLKTLVSYRKNQILSKVNILTVQDYPNVHPIIREMFSNEQMPDLPAAGRLKFFTQNWEKLTQDPQIL